jgi:50S ribosomal subunit-associated GTPase HflX
LPTLDEIKFADIILVVLDVSLLEKDKKYFDLQFETVLNVLERFKNFIEKKHFQDYENLNYNKKVILVFNKADKLTKQVDSLLFKSLTSCLSKALHIQKSLSILNIFLNLSI